MRTSLFILCLLLSLLSAIPCRADDTVGRLRRDDGETVYISFDKETAALVSRVHERRLTLKIRKTMLADSLTDSDDDDEKWVNEAAKDLADAQKQLRERKKAGFAKEIRPGAAALLLDTPISDTDERTDWQVLILTGKEKGLTGYVNCFDRTGIDKGDTCFVYPVAGERFAFGTSDLNTLQEFLGYVSVGDDRNANRLLRRGRVRNAEVGSAGRCVDIDENWYEIRLHTGTQKGKFLWFASDCLCPVDRKYLKRLVAGAQKKRHPLKPTTEVPPRINGSHE